MIRRLQQFFSAVPTPLSGLALGIVSLGVIVDTVFACNAFIQIVSAMFSFALIMLVVLKFVFNPFLFRKDISHHILGSVIPTTTMAMMLQAKSIALLNVSFAEIYWLSALSLHIILLLWFIYHRIQEFDLEHMAPSWFVPCVGICVAGLSYPSDRLYDIAHIIVYLGMANCAVLFPVMWYRLIFVKEIHDNFKPTIAILAAPASLSLVAYLSVEKEPSVLVLALLFGIAILMTVIIYFSFIRLLRLPFSPAFAAYTFPLAVSATALYKFSGYLSQFEMLFEYSQQLKIIAYFELAIAIVVIAYVCYQYLVFYTHHIVLAIQARRQYDEEECVCDKFGNCTGLC